MWILQIFTLNWPKRNLFVFVSDKKTESLERVTSLAELLPLQFFGLREADMFVSVLLNFSIIFHATVRFLVVLLLLLVCFCA